MAQAPHRPDDKSRKQVLALVGFGMTRDQVAKVMDISDETLRKYYKDELQTGSLKLNAQVAQNLFNIATGDRKGSVAAAIFWLKTRAKWKETLDLSNEDGTLRPEPVQIAVMNALKKAHEAD